MIKQNKTKLFVATFLFGLLFSCKKNNTTETAVTPDNGLNGYITKLQPVPTSTPIPAALTTGDPLINWDGTTYCKTTKYTVGPQFSEGFLLNPQAEVIYPGAILDGNSINDGSYKLISLARTGGTISTDLSSASVSSKTIDETIKSKVQQGLQDLLNTQLTGTSAAQINFDISDIYSEKQVDMNLGFSLGVANKVKIKGGFDFNSLSKKSRVLIKFQQIYYTVSYDPKTKPADYFQNSVTIDDLKQAVGNTTVAPVYVSNVKYGRLAYYCFESDMTQSDLKATLDAAFSNTKVSAQVDVTYKQKLIDNKTKITGLILGGNGSNAVEAISGIDGFYSYIKQGGDYSATSPGLPIAYTLRRISDNGVFNVVNYSDYVVNECSSTTGSVKMNSLKHSIGSQDDKIWGTIDVNLGYDDTGFANNATNLFSGATKNNAIVTGTNGNIVNFPSNNFNLAYDPSKFDKAYLEITFNINNSWDWSNVGLDNHSGTTTAELKNKKYKVYLKDLKNNTLGTDWQVNNNQSTTTYDLIVITPYKNATDRACVKKFLGGCTDFNDIDVSKAESTMLFNFSLTLNK